jgi:ribosomal protein L27
MSQLNFMEKLLDGVAVEWKALGEVLVRTKGTKITAGQMSAPQGGSTSQGLCGRKDCCVCRL